MKTLFTFLFIAFFSSASAFSQALDSLRTPKFQKFSTAGAKGGMNVSSLNNYNNSDSGLGFVVGLTGEYRFSKSFGLATELNYSKQNSALQQNELEMNYLAMPLLITLHDNDFMLQAGAYGAILLKAKANYGKITEDITEHFTETESGLCLGLAYNFWGNTIFGVRFYRGLQDINKSITDSGLELRNSTLQITGGYTF